MRNTSTLFRVLIVVGLSLAIVGASIDMLVPALISDELTTAYNTETELQEWSIARITAVIVLSLALLVAGIASTIGLFLFKPWSRRMALLVTLLALPLYPMLGPVLQSGWATMLIETSTTLWGAVLALAYYSDLSTRFARIDR